MALGAASIVMLAIYAPHRPGGLLGLAGIAALLMTIHLGIGDLLPWLLRWAGFAVPPLFRPSVDCWLPERPLGPALEPGIRRYEPADVTAADVWAFWQTGFAPDVVCASGVLHELALSFPAGGG